MLRYIAIVALAWLVGLPAPAAAQAQDDPPEGRANRPALDPLRPAAVADMLDTYALVQAQEVLRLTDAQYAPFVTQLRNLQKTRRRNQQARNQIVRELGKLTAPAGGAAGRQNQPQTDEAATAERQKANEATIRDRLKTLRDLDDRAAIELRQAYDALDEVLDARQQARFRVFEEMLERRKLDLLMRARQGAARRGR